MMKSEKGFTLIELLIVVAIIGILATAATTAYIGVTTKAARSEAYANLETLRLLQEQFYAENAIYVVNAIYNATPGDGGGGIEDLLPGFRPGGCINCGAPFGLNYQYSIQQNVALPNGVIPVPYNWASVVQIPCFIATAQGVVNTRVAGDVFVIDCNNAKNF